MSKYELTVVYLPTLTEKSLKKELTSLKALVDDNKGKVIKKDDWGKKPLSYQIKKQTEGFYAHRGVELPEKAVVKVRSALRMNEKAMRYLIVKKEE